MTEFRPSSFQILPPVIKNLLIINCLVFLAQQVLGQGTDPQVPFDRLFALHAWQSDLFKPWQLVTHMFMHGGYYHIFGNMFALWMFGSVLENVWGAKRFLIFYFVCGLGAALIHLLFLSYELVPMMRDFQLLAARTDVGSADFAAAVNHFTKIYQLAAPRLNPADYASDPSMLAQVLRDIAGRYHGTLDGGTIGASGAVFGVLAAFVYLFPNTYLYLYFFVPVKAKWVGLGYFAYELFFAIKNSAGDDVARWAHVGGAIVGLIIVITWNKTKKKKFY